MSTSETLTNKPGKVIQSAEVMGNRRLCRDHFRLSLRLHSFPPARPGQFVHLSPELVATDRYRVVEWKGDKALTEWRAEMEQPMLRRAFSIAGLRRPFTASDGAEIDIIHRVVGTATRWLASRAVGDRVSLLGPLGNGFPVRTAKRRAWLVAGGVGLPPMLWLAEALAAAGRDTTAFCGAQTVDLLPLTIRRDAPPAADAKHAAFSAEEFAAHHVPVVLSTDDGSLGFAGHVGGALHAFHVANSTPSDDVVVYTCGPERMMRFVAEFCAARAIECHVCMERAMACGTGTCQSCVVPVVDPGAGDGWCYQLCCVDGPVFEARRVLWAPAARP